MPNFINLRNPKPATTLPGRHRFIQAINLLNWDCISRLVNFSKLSLDKNRGIWWLILTATAMQVLCEYLPFISWIIWPFLVYLCTQSMLDQDRAGGLRTQYLTSAIKAINSLKSKGEVVIALFLYGALGLIIFRGLMEALNWLQIDWNLLPQAVITLLPFTFSEAFSILFIATCAYRLKLDDRDPFKTLSLSLRDLFITPFSTIFILFLQTVLCTTLAMSMAMYFRTPLLATFLGHAPFILFVLVWICGQSIEKENEL